MFMLSKIKKAVLTAAMGGMILLGCIGVTSASEVPQDLIAKIKAWHQQRLESRANMLQQRVEAGIITPEQKEAILQRMKKRFALRESLGFVNCRSITPDGKFVPNPRGTGLGLGPRNGQEFMCNGPRLDGTGFCRGFGCGRGFDNRAALGINSTMQQQ